MKLAKIEIRPNSWVWGYVTDDDKYFVTPSGRQYEIDEDGFVLYGDGKKYRLIHVMK